MPNFPERTRTSRVGSNLKPKAKAALDAYEEHATAARLKPLVQARRRFGRDTRRFLTKSVIRSTADVFRANRLAVDRALLAANGKGSAITSARATARRTIERALQQQIDGYAQFQATRRANAAAYQVLVDQQLEASIDRRVTINLGAVIDAQFDATEFAPPYPLFVVEPMGEVLALDTSVVDPRLGFVVNHIAYDFDHHDPFLPGTGFTIMGAVTSRASVGVNYTVPDTGRITFSAVLQNVFNHISYSLSDNLGFSSGELYVSLSLFVRIIRGSDVIGLERYLYQNGLISHGSDVSQDFSGLDMATPVTLTATTDETFNQGEAIQVLVGSSVTIDADLNDMEAVVNTTEAWQVKKIYLAMS